MSAVRRDLLTVKEVAEELRVHPETVREKLRHGDIKGIKIGKAWRIKREDLDEFLETK